MNEKIENVDHVEKSHMLEAGATAASAVPSPSRRRLIKLGAAGVPVVATLASSPAMAWNCRAPSAWGSHMSGALSASQAANPAQVGKKAETWTITNWATNTARSATGISAKPWDQLVATNTNLYYGITGAPTDKYKKVTLSALAANTGIVAPSGANGGSSVVDLLVSGDAFTKSLIVAQLNSLYPTSANQMNTCLMVNGQNQLKLMATGTYTPTSGGTPWDKAKIVTYLQNNYMAVA
jgi:hypothetical protein